MKEGWTRRLLCLTSLWALGAQAVAPQSMAKYIAHQQLLQSGQNIFKIHCAGCHGVDAHGVGNTWAMLNPKPRNLASGAFKFRTTPLGTLPTTEDLLRTIEQGVVGASMPGFPLLSAQEKFALVTFIKSLRPDWDKNEGKAYALPSVPREIFENKTLFLASAFKGQKLFMEGCATCHGAGGLGDGEGAEGLVDNENQPIRPANLTKSYIKSGRRVQDIYKAILTGLDGTPMPSFDGVYSEAQIWDIVAYVMFLRGRGAGMYDESVQLEASWVKAAENFNKQKSSPAASGKTDSWE